MSTATAVRLAGQGYRVFPVGPDKRPLIKGWPAKATNDEMEVLGLWADRPGADVGIATGDGLVVIDLDVKNGVDGIASWTGWAEAQGVSWTSTTDTRSGGQHVYLRTREKFGNRVGLLSGVDVRAEGGYVVAYEDVPALKDLPRLPSEVSELLQGKVEAETTRTVGPGGIKAALDMELFKVEICEEGMRNHVLNAAAYNLGQLVGPHLDEDDVIEQLTEAAEKSGLDAEETRETILSGLAAGKANPRSTTDAAPAVERGSWTPVNIAALLASGLVSLKPTVLRRSDGVALLYPGRTHSISGESGSGKSWLAQWAVAGVLRNGDAALYLDYESSAASVVARLRALGCSDEDLSRLTYVNPDAAPTGEEFEELLGSPYVLAIIDGVTEALATSGMTGDSLTNNNDAVTKWHAMLPKRIAVETGAAVAQIDHVTKSKDSRGSYAIGGQAKRASITGASYTVAAHESFGRNRSGSFDVYVGKDREGYVLGALEGEDGAAGRLVGRCSVTCEEDGNLDLSLDAVEIASREDWTDVLRERILEQLAELPEGHEGLTTNTLVKRTTGNEGRLRSTLERLVEDGAVIRTARLQSQYHKVNPERED